MEVKSVPAFFGHHLSLSIPEERIEDDDKVLTTRYTPLGVVGAICPWYVPSHDMIATPTDLSADHAYAGTSP